mgnify:CR=1 FL=1
MHTVTVYCIYYGFPAFRLELDRMLQPDGKIL